MDIMDIFFLLKFFSRAEKWGDPDRMDHCTLIILERLRVFSGSPIFVHRGADLNAKPSSCHYISAGGDDKAKAVDFSFPKITLLEAHELIQEFLKKNSLIDQVGLGIYPQWNNQGFHLDTRGFKARWSKINGKYTSYELALKL